MRILTVLLLTLLALQSLGQDGPEVNLIQVEHHAFSVNTPDGWVNDKDLAAQIGIASFFYALADKDKEPKSHIYATGFVKGELNRDLERFMKGDLENFRKKYPAASYTEIEMEKPKHVLDIKMRSYSNLEDRYKEEVIYIDTDGAVLVMVFSAFSEAEYQKYRPVLDELLASFQNRSE